MYLAPLNYDLFFKKVFSSKEIAKQFLEDFFGFVIEEIKLLPLNHKLTNESSLLQFDYRCKVNGDYIIIEMQQWYKHDVVKRFYLYHAANTVIQLEDLPLKKVGQEKKVKDYSGIIPVKTLIWMVDDALDFTEDYSAYIMLPEAVEDFLKDENIWSSNNCVETPEIFKKSYDILLKKRTELLGILQNDKKGLLFLKKNKLVFAFQRNIINNLQKARQEDKFVQPYMRWFEFAAKTRKENNTKNDFIKFEEDKVFKEIMRRLNHSSLNDSEKEYIHYYQELEGVTEVKMKDARKEGKIEGKKEEKEGNIIALIKQNILTLEQIATAFSVDIEYVRKLQKSINDEK